MDLNVIRSMEVTLATSKELQPAIAWLVTKSINEGLLAKATRDAKVEFVSSEQDVCKLQRLAPLQKSNIAGPSLFSIIGCRCVWVFESTREAKRREWEEKRREAKRMNEVRRD